MPQSISVPIPSGGLLKRTNVSEKALTYSEDCLNVFGDDIADQRERVSTRPGTAKLFAQDLGTTVDAITSVAFIKSGVRERRLVAVADGKVYLDKAGTMTQIGTALVDTDGYVSMVEHLQKVYIARAATSGKILILDPVAETLTAMTSSPGTAPTGCRVIARYKDRLVVADDLTHNVYFSRQGDPLDWDYAASDVGGAYNFGASDAGVIPDRPRALITHSDQCIIIGCDSSFYVLRSDARTGGTLDLLTKAVGIVDHQAWCHSPEGYLWLLTNDGLYFMPQSCGGQPASVSREKCPEELIGIDRDTYKVSMCYDADLRGIHLNVVRKTSNQTNVNPDFCPATPQGSTNANGTFWTSSYFVDIRNTASQDQSSPGGANFWPVTKGANNEVTSCFLRRSALDGKGTAVLGCRDGYLRTYDRSVVTDDGETFRSYCLIGPVKIGDSLKGGMLQTIQGVLGFGSDDIEIEVFAADVAERALGLTAHSSYTWSGDGLQRNNHVKARGAYVYILLRGATDSQWSIEEINGVVDAKGRKRTVYR